MLIYKHTRIHIYVHAKALRIARKCLRSPADVWVCKCAFAYNKYVCVCICAQTSNLLYLILMFSFFLWLFSIYVFVLFSLTVLDYELKCGSFALQNILSWLFRYVFGFWTCNAVQHVLGVLGNSFKYWLTDWLTE